MKKNSPNKPPTPKPLPTEDTELEYLRKKQRFRRVNVALISCIVASAGMTALCIALCMSGLILAVSIPALFLASVSLVSHLTIERMNIQVMKDELERSKLPPLPGEQRT